MRTTEARSTADAIASSVEPAVQVQSSPVYKPMSQKRSPTHLLDVDPGVEAVGFEGLVEKENDILLAPVVADHDVGLGRRGLMPET